MGFLAPAMPWILKGGAALGGMLMSKKSQSNAMKRSPEEQTSLTGAQNAGANMQQSGAGMVTSGAGNVNAGVDTMQKPTDYFTKLLGGNRAAMAQATAGSKGAITDTYRGAENALNKSGVRGAQRDVAKADLNRDRASKIAGLTTGVQPGAAQQLGALGEARAGVGTNQASTGANMQANAGNIFTNLLGQGADNRAYARSEGADTGKKFGGFLFDMLKGVKGMGGDDSGDDDNRPFSGSKSYAW